MVSNRDVSLPWSNWTTASPETQGIDPSMLARADVEIQAKLPNVYNFLLVRNGFLVYERYYRGAGPNDVREIMSADKSMLSALVGIALKEGWLQSVEQKAVDFFPEYIQEQMDPQVSELTLRHLLTMTSGFYYTRLKGDSQPIWARTIRSKNPVEFSLNLPVKDKMGVHFNYKNTDALLMAAILTKVSGKSIAELAEAYLLQPLDIPSASAWRTEQPEQLKAGPFSMTARDMAKFGVLYLNGGQWNGKQIIPADWVKESTSPQVGNYGYLWWVHENGYSASGAGGTLLRMIPKLGVAAVFQCKHLNRFRDPRIIVDEWIVPAVAETRTMSSAIMENGKRKGDCNSLS